MCNVGIEAASCGCDCRPEKDASDEEAEEANAPGIDEPADGLLKQEQQLPAR